MSESDWKFDDYEVIATGGGEKLERWGGVTLLRPDPQAIWSPVFALGKFDGLHAHYRRSKGVSGEGGGAWQVLRKMPEEWTVAWDSSVGAGLGCKFLISPTSFKHTGLFPEQSVNWARAQGLICGGMCDITPQNGVVSVGAISVLNLFGYTGGATVACAKAGAYVTHVDASKGMVAVAKRNVELNDIPSDRVRYIVDDCMKFVQRELRRGKRYDAIIMDPPSFGRGAGGEVWKIEEHLDPLVRECCKLLSDKPLFFLINSYTTGLQAMVMRNVLGRNLAFANVAGGVLESYDLNIPTREGISLPAGCSAIAVWKSKRSGEK